MSNKIIVTTTDLKTEYDVLGPVYFSVSNKGLFGSQLGNLVKKYKGEIENLKKESLLKEMRLEIWKGLIRIHHLLLVRFTLFSILINLCVDIDGRSATIQLKKEDVCLDGFLILFTPFSFVVSSKLSNTTLS